MLGMHTSGLAGRSALAVKQYSKSKAPALQDHMFDGFGMLLKFEIDGASNTVTSSHR